MPLLLEIVAVPTVSDLEDRWGLRKEALRSLNATEKAAAISAAFDEVIAALGKRVTRPVVFVDDWIKALVCRIASANLLGWRRGFDDEAGKDSFIREQLELIRADLESIATGTREPYFADATAQIAEQGPIGGGDVTADAWVRRGCGFYPWRSPCGGC